MIYYIIIAHNIMIYLTILTVVFESYFARLRLVKLLYKYKYKIYYNVQMHNF
jgi:hypothetical protein